MEALMSDTLKGSVVLLISVIFVSYPSLDTTTATSPACPMTLPSSLQPNIVDAGEVPVQQDNIQVAVPWKNPTSQVLKIDKLIPTCHCTGVKPNIETIEAGQAVQFVVDIDVRNWFGHGAISFIVSFRDKPIEPVLFKVKFYRPRILQANPKVVDFGTVDNPNESSRRFDVTWISESTETGLQIKGEMYSEKGTVECVAQKEERRDVRLLNSNISTLRQRFLFTVFLRFSLTRGRFDDVIHIPVTINGNRSELTVPVTGVVTGQVFARPSRVLAVLTDITQKAEHQVTLFRQDWVKRPTNIRVSCEDPRLLVNLVDNYNHEDKSVVAQIRIISQSHDADLIDAVITVECEIGSYMDVFHIPVRILMLK
jgi:hypothetical protein